MSHGRVRVLELSLAGMSPFNQPVLDGPVQVLLVDDDTRLLSSMARLLKRLPVEVATAGSAEDALVWLNRGGAPSLVLTDLSMPGMNGLELLEEVKRLRPHALRMLYTGDTELWIRLTPGTAFTLISKPAHPDLVLRWVYAAMWARK